jgi:hypothetical protein
VSSRYQRIELQRQIAPKSHHLGVNFAPICALVAKLTKKPGENREKSDEKWREMALFRG